MIGVIVPAHDEEALIERCLRSILVAASHAALRREPVQVVVALDRCSDRTGAIARALEVRCIVVDAGNVGTARAAAAAIVLEQGARWIATTDADSVVPPDWISAQIAYGCDAFCGIVAVDDWDGYGLHVANAFRSLERDHVGHPHVHGANLGIEAHTYRRSGGFQSLALSEDVALIDALVESGATIARQPTPVVITSSRRVSRASGGFSHYLSRLDTLLARDATAPLDAFT